jgi:hypothetical protein
MIVRAVDQATVPLDNVKRKLDEVTGSLEESQIAGGDALDALGQKSGELGDEFEDLGEAAGNFGGFISQNLPQLIAIGTVAVIGLFNKIKDVIEEHERLVNTAERLDLPTERVENYSKAWLKVAEELSDAARGFTELKDSQTRAFAALNIDPRGAGAADAAITRIAAASGTRQEKIDALRILTGRSYDEMAAELDKEMKRLTEVLGGYRDYYGDLVGTTTRAQQEGVVFGQTDVGKLLKSGQLSTDLQLRKTEEQQREIDQWAKDIQTSFDRAIRAAESGRKDAADDLVRSRLQQQRDAFNRQAEYLHDQAKAVQDLEKSTADSIERTNRDIARSANQAMGDIEQRMSEAAKNIKYPFEDTIGAIQDGLRDAVSFADFSLKHLVERIIINLTQKKLFDAIDHVGDALRDAFGGAGGGFLGGVGKFFGSLFGGNAGGGTASGIRRVGEDGEELVSSGINSMRIYNRRQLQFLAGNASAPVSQPIYAPTHHYTISGVETSQVIEYIERTRKADQQAWVQKFKDNGFGRLR